MYRRHRHDWPDLWLAIDDLVTLLDGEHPPAELPRPAAAGAPAKRAVSPPGTLSASRRACASSSLVRFHGRYSPELMPERSGSDGGTPAVRARMLLERRHRFETMCSRLAELAERTQRLDALLDELHRTHQLDAVLVELVQTQRLDALDVLATALVNQSDRLEAVVIDADDADDFDAWMADLVESTDQVGEVIAQLQRHIAPPPVEP